MRSTLAAVAIAVLIFGAILFGMWAWFVGPCDLYSFTRAADIPARCL